MCYYFTVKNKSSSFFFNTFVDILYKSYNNVSYVDSKLLTLCRDRSNFIRISNINTELDSRFFPEVLFMFNNKFSTYLYCFPTKLDKLNFNFMNLFNPTNKFYYEFILASAVHFPDTPAFLFINSELQNTYNWSRATLFGNLMKNVCAIDFRSVCCNLDSDSLEVDNDESKMDYFYLTRPEDFKDNFIEKIFDFTWPITDTIDVNVHEYRFPYEQIDSYVYDDTFGYRVQTWFMDWTANSSQFPASLFMFSKFYDIIFSNTVTYINFFNTKSNLLDYNYNVVNDTKTFSNFVAHHQFNPNFKLDLPLYFLNTNLLKQYMNSTNSLFIKHLDNFFWSSKFFFMRSIIFIIWELYSNLLDLFVFSNNALYFFNKKFPNDLKSKEFNFNELVNVFSKQLNVSLINSMIIDAFSPAFLLIQSRFFDAFKFQFLSKDNLIIFLDNFLFNLTFVLRKLSVDKLQRMYLMLSDYSSFILNSFSSFNFFDSNFQTGLISYMYYLITRSNSTEFKLSTTLFPNFKHKYFSDPTRDVMLSTEKAEFSTMYDRKFVGDGYTFFDNPYMFITEFEFFFRNYAQFEYFSSFELNLFSFIDLVLSDVSKNQQFQRIRIRSIFDSSTKFIVTDGIKNVCVNKSGVEIQPSGFDLYFGINSKIFFPEFRCSFKFSVSIDKTSFYCIKQVYTLFTSKLVKLIFYFIYIVSVLGFLIFFF